MSTFARRCDITGEGMNEGYCFHDGCNYAKSEESALIVAKKYGYNTLEEAYKDGAYYYTEWEKSDRQFIVCHKCKKVTDIEEPFCEHCLDSL